MPPLALGAAHTSDTPPTVSDGTGAVGAPGEPRSVIDVDGADATEVPAAFVAVTVKVYGIPRFNPVTVIGEAVPEAVEPFDAVTVYPVIVEPPFVVGAENETVAPTVAHKEKRSHPAS